MNHPTLPPIKTAWLPGARRADRRADRPAREKSIPELLLKLLFVSLQRSILRRKVRILSRKHDDLLRERVSLLGGKSELCVQDVPNLLVESGGSGNDVPDGGDRIDHGAEIKQDAAPDCNGEPAAETLPASSRSLAIAWGGSEA